MRHVYIRSILALIWLAAVIVSGMSGNLEWTGFYVLLFPRLRQRKVVGLIGLNGASKTTFPKTLSGGLHEGFHCDSIRLYCQSVTFRDEGFKLCWYTVFVEDNAFGVFQRTQKGTIILYN